jgi:decaprenylphospho-beta-D-ribofuranose 2-oxidase
MLPDDIGRRTAPRLTVCGWGRYPRSTAEIWRPEKLSELSEALAASSKPVLARGLGRAYGDAALNNGGSLINLTRLNRMLAFDAQSGSLRCEAGVTFAELLEIFVPRGFFPPVTPGTKFVTLGGALAADIHGKNHHRDSSISKHVVSFDLMGPEGQIKRCSREENSDLFWATIGGMGLTGVIVELELKLKRIESAYLECESLALPDIDRVIETFADYDRRYEYSVAWVDCAAGAKELGRAIAMFAGFASADRLDRQIAHQPLMLKPHRSLRLPFDMPQFILNPLTIRGFNALYYFLHRRGKPHSVVDLERFFYPLDRLGDWNRLYGRRGLTQHQCVIPLACARVGLIEMLEELKRTRIASCLAVLKQFGPQEGMLSFPMPGYTLAMDFAVRDGLSELMGRLDRVVLKYGGRLYLAKDAFARSHTVHQMYPNLEQWRAIKLSADPNGVFSSQLSRRLNIDAVARKS